jgi:Uma2 family endonuclease
MEKMLPHPASLIANPIRPLKRVEYDKLVAEGCFRKERVELIFGMVVAMSPTDPAHGESMWRVDDRLRRNLGDRARVACQRPFAATDDSEPEPDIVVFPPGDYWDAHPDRAYLVVEVARSSLEHDQGPKALLYAMSQVDEYWIVDHAGGVVEIYRDRQTDGSWQTRQTFARGDVIAMQAFPDVQISVADILPPA